MPVRHVFRFIAFAIAAYFAAPTAADAVTHRVPSDYGTIQAGIDAAAEGDTVLVAPGVYTGEGNKNLDIGPVNLVLRSEAGADATIIDCEGDGRGMYIHSFNTSIIEGLTVTNAFYCTPWPVPEQHLRYAGGIFCVSAYPTIRACVVSNSTGGGPECTEGTSGAGITSIDTLYGKWDHPDRDTLRVIDSVIEGNESQGGGAGLRSANTHLVIENSVIRNNVCRVMNPELSSGSGGGLFVDNGIVRVSSSEITGNSVEGNLKNGGGVVCWVGLNASDNYRDYQFVDCTITENEGGRGGGIAFSQRLYRGASDSTPESGGSMSASVADTTTYRLERCTISNNSARDHGGGLMYYQAVFNGMDVVNCTISDNTAGNDGGGVYWYRTRFESTMTNCTITGNESAGEGGGIMYGSRAASLKSLLVKNSIVWGNTSADDLDIDDNGVGSIVTTYSNVGSGWEDEGNISADPLFADAANGDYHLTDGSPCVDTGTADGAPDTDFEGDPRPIGDGYDMGVDEHGGGGAPCDLELALSNYPASVERGSRLSFRVDATNGCDESLTFDRVVMSITGPASRESVLHDGTAITVVSSVGKDLSMMCPSIAPLGTYTFEITIYRDGEAIDADAFDVDITG